MVYWVSIKRSRNREFGALLQGFPPPFCHFRIMSSHFLFPFIDAFNIFLTAKKQNIVFDNEAYARLINLLLMKDNSPQAMQVKDL